MKPRLNKASDAGAARRLATGMLVAAAALCLLAAAARPDDQSGGRSDTAPPPPTLEETRLTMGKWIETQQIISKERKDWQQGKEILQGRVELVKKEVAGLEEKIRQAESNIAEAAKQRDDLLKQNDALKASGTQLTDAVAAMEVEVRKLYRTLPEPVQAKLQPLYQRMPEEGAATRVSAAERFQNVLGILNELNKANTEIAVTYEVHTLADGKPAEVQVVYIGLAQGYYVSPGGEAGIGRPGDDGWKWEASNGAARDILMVLDILQGKHTPAFVPLPVKIK